MTRRAGWAVWAAGCLLAGCAGDGAGPATAPPTEAAAEGAARGPGTVAFSAEAGLLYKRTLVRDPAPACAELVAGLADPLAALVEVAEKAVAPGMSSVRAATCVAQEHAEAGQAALVRWVGAKATQGLAIVVTNHLDRLPAPTAEVVARAALAGEAAEALRPRLARTEAGRRAMR
jgi:hypothetical protein